MNLNEIAESAAKAVYKEDISVEAKVIKLDAYIRKIARLVYKSFKNNIRKYNDADIVSKFYDSKLRLFDEERGSFKTFVEIYMKRIAKDMVRQHHREAEHFSKWREDPTIADNHKVKHNGEYVEIITPSKSQGCIDDPLLEGVQEMQSCSGIKKNIDRSINECKDGKAIKLLKQYLSSQGMKDSEIAKFNFTEAIKKRRKYKTQNKLISKCVK